MSTEQIAIVISFIMALIALLLGIANNLLSRRAQRRALEKNYPILYPHLSPKEFLDVGGWFPQYKGKILNHYKMVNIGDIDAEEWGMEVYMGRDGDLLTNGFTFSFSGVDIGTVVKGNQTSPEFVPSILKDDAFYEINQKRLVVVEYSDIAGKEYCTCKWFDSNGTPITGYKNSEKTRRFNKRNFSRKAKRCKDCFPQECLSGRKVFLIKCNKLSEAVADSEPHRTD